MMMPTTKSRSWKMERASVSRQGRSRPRSNKYSKSDAHKRPAAGWRQRVWVGGYTRGDGTRVNGHYRATAAA
jgi:hypothetical protein